MDLFDRKTGVFKHFNKEDGFPAIGINLTIQEDRDGYLWIGTTDNGLIKFNIKNQTVDSVFSKSDGLQDDHFWRSYKKRDGEMWFGGGYGVNRFYPDKVKKNKTIPPVVLTSFTQGGSDVNMGKAPERLRHVILGWKETFFEFQFAALNYTKPGKNRYAYMLQGRDQEWHYCEGNPSGRYTGLGGGTYTLRLKGSNNDGVWNEEGAVIRIDDVTEQVRMEEMMVQSEKMLSVGGLAAGMAHEINNPLAGMIQTANVMGNRLTNIEIPASQSAALAVGTNIETIKAYMEKRGILPMIEAINVSGRRMAAIVDNMLSFARKSDARVSSHALADLLAKTIDLAATDYDLKRHYDFRQIEIREEYEDELSMVPCEGAKIQQVLLNIFSNGAQAMQENIKNKNGNRPRFILRLAREADTNMVRLEIGDNGPGMDEATQKRVFEPFFTTKPVGLGTGLGLSVSYFIITENHGGTMDVISEPGKGVTFIIRLPLDRQWTQVPAT
jgi:signal transduction histidine kinase